LSAGELQADARKGNLVFERLPVYDKRTGQYLLTLTGSTIS
jgi:hypothetical protein